MKPTLRHHPTAPAALPGIPGPARRCRHPRDDDRRVPADGRSRYPHNLALSTPDGSVRLTWRQYGTRVRALASGLWALGVRPGDTVGLMLTNRPEFHLVDTAALHVGATPFSIYNTLAPEQIAHLFGNAGNRVVVCEQQFLDQIRKAAEAAGTSVEHIVCVDAGVDGTISLADVEATSGRRVRLRRDLAGRPPRRRPHDHLHLGHDRPAQGRRDHAREHAWPSCAPTTALVARSRRTTS